MDKVTQLCAKVRHNKINAERVVLVNYKPCVEIDLPNFIYIIYLNRGKDKRFPKKDENYKYECWVFNYNREVELDLRDKRNRLVCSNWVSYCSKKDVDEIINEHIAKAENVRVWNHIADEQLKDKTKMTNFGELNTFDKKMEKLVNDTKTKENID